MHDNTESPDSIQPILAIRAWNIHQENQIFYLASCYQYNLIWPISTYVAAHCTVNDPWNKSGIKHSAPILDCDCGIYALKKMPEETELLPWEKNSILGLAFLWGKIIEGTKGYRAQYSKPAALLEDDRKDIIYSIARNYSIPVVKDLNISENQLHFDF